VPYNTSSGGQPPPLLNLDIPVARSPSTIYRAQISRDRKSAARERISSEAIIGDNYRIEQMYTDDNYAFLRHKNRKSPLKAEMVIYPGF
jgi:hypothetical protein